MTDKIFACHDFRVEVFFQRRDYSTHFWREIRKIGEKIHIAGSFVI